MRKKGVLILLALLILAAVIAFLTRDSYLERALESAGRAAAGAKVELDGFHFSLFRLSCSWDRLQVADRNDTWRNILETGRAAFSMEARPLFWRRVIIRELSLENVRSGTRRATDGFIPVKPGPRAEKKPGMLAKVSSSLTAQMQDLPVLDLSALGTTLNIDSLIAVDNLETFRAYSELRRFTDSTFSVWNDRADPAPYRDRLAKLEADIGSLNIDRITDVITLAAALKKVRDIQKEAASLRKDLNASYTALAGTFSDLDTRIEGVDGGLASDIERAQQLARMRDLDVRDVGLLLFGAPLVQKTEKLLGYMALTRRYLPTAEKALSREKKRRPPRFQGQDIRFPFTRGYPAFLLRSARFSAAGAAADTSGPFFIEGTVTGVTTDPALYGRPARFSLTLRKASGDTYGIQGMIDRTGAVPRDSLRVTAAGIDLGTIALQSGANLPAAVTAPSSDLGLAGYLSGEAVDISLNMAAAPVTFSYTGEASDAVSRIVRDVLTGLSRVTISARLQGDSAGYGLRMNSNVDRVLAGRIRAVLDDKVSRARQQVETYVRAEADERRQGIVALIEQNRLTTLAEVDALRKQVGDRVDALEKLKKEIEQRLKE
ncbi:TIGR03545 family protein [bacterium]|nr:TIGR03545 family protein [bacterium]